MKRLSQDYLKGYRDGALGQLDRPKPKRPFLVLFAGIWHIIVGTTIYSKLEYQHLADYYILTIIALLVVLAGAWFIHEYIKGE